MNSARVKDSEYLEMNFGPYKVRACDVDQNGYVENIDIVQDGMLLSCINIQDSEPLTILFALLMQAQIERV